MQNETRYEVKAFKVELMCDNPGCGGVLESCGGMVLATYPAQYPHQCTDCGKTKHIGGKIYPYMEYEGAT